MSKIFEELPFDNKWGEFSVWYEHTDDDKRELHVEFNDRHAAGGIIIDIDELLELIRKFNKERANYND